MSRQAMRWFIIVGVFGSAVFHMFVIGFEWYKSIETIDKYQHFFGGAVVVVFFLYWAYERYPHLFQGPWYVQWVVFLGFALVIGVGWEIFEYTFDNYWGQFVASGADSAQPSLQDTMLDLIADSGGALLGLLIFWRKGGKSVLK